MAVGASVVVVVELLLAVQHGEPRLRDSSGGGGARKTGGAAVEVGEAFLVLMVLLLLIVLTLGEDGTEDDAIVHGLLRFVVWRRRRGRCYGGRDSCSAAFASRQWGAVW